MGRSGIEAACCGVGVGRFWRYQGSGDEVGEGVSGGGDVGIESEGVVGVAVLVDCGEVSAGASGSDRKVNSGSEVAGSCFSAPRRAVELIERVIDVEGVQEVRNGEVCGVLVDCERAMAALHALQAKLDGITLESDMMKCEKNEICG